MTQETQWEASLEASKSKDTWWFWGMVVVLAYLPLLPYAFAAPTTMDYWFFLAKGDRLRELGLGSLGGANPFVFTTPEGSVFLDKEWLFGLGLRWFWELFGHSGTVVLRAFWVFLWCVLFFSVARRLGANRWMTLCVFGLGAYSVLITRMSVRPHSLGYLFLLLLFWLLAEPPKRSSLVMVVVMFALWANIHGSFAVGGALLGTVGVWACVGPFLYQRRDPAFAAYISKWRAWWWVLPMLPLVVCLNPYGWRLWQVLWTFQREVSGRPDIVVAPEWEAFSLQSPYGVFLLGITFLLGATWFLPGARRRSQWLLWSGLAVVLALSNLRFVGVSFLLLGPLLAAQLSALERPLLRWMASGALALAALAMGAQAWSHAPSWRLSPRMESSPVEAMRILEQHPSVRARLFADLNPAGYIAFRLHRRVQVAYDGNPMTPGFWAWSQSYKAALLSTEVWETYCTKHRCEMVLLDLRHPINSSLAAHLAVHKKWRALYASLRWVLYVRRDREPKVLANAGFQWMRSFYDTGFLAGVSAEKVSRELSLLRKQPDGGPLADWIETTRWLSAQRLGPFSARLSFKASQQQQGLRFLRRMQEIERIAPWHPGVLYTLGILELFAGQSKKALRSFGKASSWNPYWPQPFAGLYRAAKEAKHPQFEMYARRSLRSMGAVGQEVILRLRVAETGVDVPSAPR